MPERVPMHQPTTLSRRRAIYGLLALSGLTALQPAQARKSRARHPTGETAGSSRVRIQGTRSSSEETSAERDRRLYRECQGRPNSGACAGYTQAPPSRRR